MGGNDARRSVFEPILLDVKHVSPCYAYRGMGLGENFEEYAERLARELDTTITLHPPGSVIGFVLVTPFDSLEALAREHYWWAPVGLLLRHNMPTIDFIRHTSLPTAFIAAGRDVVVPRRRSEPLRLAIPKLIFDCKIADAGHNDSPSTLPSAARCAKRLPGSKRLGERPWVDKNGVRILPIPPIDCGSRGPPFKPGWLYHSKPLK